MPGLYISCINASLKLALNAMDRNWSDALTALLGILIFFAVLPAATLMPATAAVAIAWTSGELAIFFGKTAIMQRMDAKVRAPHALVLAIFALLATAAAIYVELAPYQP
jgi:hypothetical protein